ncbi:hypothetical protein Oweho_0662 [Owenweeksia hongkongensis DSM 17368]|uniref:DUF559 domain-containing protein n=1 Tax=Owenweeksia hongkongensis (strain DSM 17368 / CIP 108786 / JCM 12287 / NRRL B-23963 / UST20020801) TaxID=926562 RepID=G8R105_OWEHD|nr:DUF559 domain-containing protein [Owenweeksia hongkongensis]AEV31676.1 hypothetical protein Oweho_0662 [Owenweeksia hongkongensis DSM 17368]
MPLHNRKYLKKYRRDLRSNLTISEARLWKALKGSQLDGRKFRRQHSIANYIVDFYCPSEKLVIEVDGGYHRNESVQIADAKRDAYLNSIGIKVLRVLNESVRSQLGMVLEAIRAEFSTTPAPPQRRGDGL